MSERGRPPRARVVKVAAGLERTAQEVRVATAAMRRLAC